MIKLFGSGRPDHPMSDARAARRILDELPPQDPFKALEELCHWHESVSLADGFSPANRIQLLLLIDDAAGERVKKITRQYLLATRRSAVQEKRLWTAAHGYWQHAGLAFSRGVELFPQGAKGAEGAKSLLPQLLVRCLHALAQQIKWACLRYGPQDAAVWGVFNHVYDFAESRNLALAEAGPGSGTPQLEFLRGLVFGASSPEGLLPAEIAMSEQIIAQLARWFQIERTGDAELAFWTDLQQAMAPVRRARPPQSSAGLRYFGVGAALAQLEALAARTRAAAAVPPELDLGMPAEPDEILALLDHLAKNWSPQGPERRHLRHSVKSRLSVANGLNGVIGALTDSSSVSFDGSDMESWVIENVSAGGFGAIVSQVKGDWLRVGAMVAMQPEGGSNWLVGLVRRVSKTAAQQARVGIETLSRSPAVSQFVVCGSRTGASVVGVLLRDNDPAAAEVRIALRPGVLAPGQNLEAEQDGRQHVFLPAGLADRGDDYEIGRFRGLVRES